MLRLRNVEQPLANFFASGIFNLREKLGPFLWQFPPQFRYDEERFEAFFALLPRDTESALALARRRDAAHDRPRLARDRPQPAAAPRGRDPPRELRRPRRSSRCCAATASRSSSPTRRASGRCYEDVTADFVYIRLHGDAELYVSGYDDAALERWARRIARWRDGDQPDDARRHLAARAGAAQRRATSTATSTTT